MKDVREFVSSWARAEHDIGYCRTLNAISSLLILIRAAPSTSFAQQVSLGSGTVMEVVERLKKGEYLWAPEMSPEGPVLVVVSLATQRAIA